MTNLSVARRIVELAARHGVRDWCVCAGSRNSPLLATLGNADGVRLWSFVDERAASFFALGLARRERRPVAVLTTSGTAAAELLPAAIEAFYSGLPLLLVTADRPVRFRGTAAPQSIEQIGIFGCYVESSMDEEAASFDLDTLAWKRRSPLHLNIAFDEPLIDGQPEAFKVVPESAGQAVAPANDLDLEAVIDRFDSPLLLVSGLDAADRDAVRDFALRLNAPVYAEPLSGLREDPALASLLLRAGERILARGSFDGIIRVGNVPTVRFWRDLEEVLWQVPVLNISNLQFPGLARATTSGGAPARLRTCRARRHPRRDELHALDEALAQRFSAILDAEPASELAMFRALSTAVPDASSLFLGNSFPVREWDLAAGRAPRDLGFDANRGANGIDGELSTFLGALHSSRANLAVLGDLTTLYDLNAPWIAAQLDGHVRFLIVIINNGGGRIFSRVPSLQSMAIGVRERLVENRHSLRFEQWAAMFGLTYTALTEIPGTIAVEGRGVLELLPDAGATRRSWAAYDELWSSP